MFSSGNRNREKPLFFGSITFKRSDKLQRQSVPRFRGISERLRASGEAGAQSGAQVKKQP
jgi:hypothetical protein